MPRTMYKCFTCGKVYGEEAKAIACHNAPVQRVVENERVSKPRFLGN